MPETTTQDHERVQDIDSHLGGCYCEAQEAGRKCTRCHVLAIVDSALAEQRERDAQVREACEEFRDSVLNSRHQLAETIEDTDQVNAVLDLYDDTIGAAIRRGDA